MGFVFLDRYDVDACAEQCNTRGADPDGGACQYFNIWRALVNGIPTTYTCSMVCFNLIRNVKYINYSQKYFIYIYFFSTTSSQTKALLSILVKEI